MVPQDPSLTVSPHLHLQPSHLQSPASGPTDFSDSLQGPASHSAGLLDTLPTGFLSQLASPTPPGWLHVFLLFSEHASLFPSLTFCPPGSPPHPTSSSGSHLSFCTPERRPLNSLASSSCTSRGPSCYPTTQPVSPRAPSGLSRQESSCQVGGCESGKA